MEMVCTHGFEDITDDELRMTDGGIAWIPIIIIGGCVAAVGLGIYNGYKS